MEYAVFISGGRQHRVSVGDVVSIDKIDTNVDGKILFDKVLLFVKEGVVTIGKPFITDAKIKASIVEVAKKGEKIDSYRFKAKSRSRKHIGFRPVYTVVKIDEILYGQKSEKKAVKKTSAK